ncbi:Mediator of RNA polymerase II transcription subunit 14 [Entophlyctis sp. JEL0112]|nr:Mediator of RNA polymerase II transcription subunit 14 [Entophlyctis sp. JEL0112]
MADPGSGMVPLRALAFALATRTHSDLGHLAESLVPMDNTGRKVTLIKHIQETRMRWIKLLVLVRWARKTGDLSNFMSILANLDAQDRCFSGAADALFRVHEEMLTAREPNYDVVTAIEILSLRNFERLPTIIRKSTIPPALLAPTDIVRAMTCLEDMIRTRLLVSEAVPNEFWRRMLIARGCVTFKVSRKFQVSLTLDASQSPAPWKLVDVQILVAFERTEYEGVLGLHDHQLKAVTEGASESLSSSIPLDSSGEPADFQHQPLVALHNYLDNFCGQLMMEVLRMQTFHLARSRWNGQLKFEFIAGTESVDTCLKIRFWSGITRGAKYFVEMKLVAIGDSSSSKGDRSLEKVIEVRTYSEKYPTSFEELVEIQEMLSAPSDTPASFILDTSTPLDVENIILRASFQEAQKLLLSLGDSLRRESMSGQVAQIRLVIDEGEFGGRPPSVKVWYRDGTPGVRFSVDTRTGIILTSDAPSHPRSMGDTFAADSEINTEGFEEQAETTTAATAAKLKNVADHVNADPDCAWDAVMGLKYSMHLDEVAVLAVSLGTQLCTDAPFKGAAAWRTIAPNSSPPRHFSVFRFEAWATCFVIIAIGGAEEIFESAESLEDPLHRMWLVLLSENPDSLSQTVRCSVPVTFDNLAKFVHHATHATNNLDDVQRAAKKRKTNEDFAAVLGSQKNIKSVFWKSIDLEFLRLVFEYARQQFCFLNALCQINDMALEYRICLPKHAQAPVLPEHLSMLSPAIIIHPFFFDIQRKIISKNEAPLDREATVEDKNSKYCFGNLYLTLEADVNGVDRIVANVRLTNEILPKVAGIQMDSSISTFNPETSIITLTAAQSDIGAVEILHHWKGLAAIAEVTSQIWTRRNWFKQHGIEIAAYSVGMLQLRIRGCRLLCEADDRPFLINLRWRRFAKLNSGGIVKVDEKLDQFVLEAAPDEFTIDGGFNPWVLNLQSLLNECLDMVVFAKRLNPISSILNFLKPFETALNKPENRIDEKNQCVVIPKSLTWVRIVIGARAIDFYVFSNNVIGMFDAFFGCADGSLDSSLLAIPSFTTPASPTGKTFVGSLPELLRSHQVSSESRLKTFPHGLLFSANLGSIIIPQVLKHVDAILVLHWLQNEVLKIKTITVKPHPPDMKILLQTSGRVAGWMYAPEVGWKFSMRNQPITSSNTQQLERQIIAFTSKFKSATGETWVNVRAVMKAFISFCDLPEFVLSELTKVLAEESRTDPITENQARVEWCIVMPKPQQSDVPDYLPSPGSLCFHMDRASGQLSFVFRLRGWDQTAVLFPVHFNYKTMVVSLWSVPTNAADFTDQELLSAMLTERMRNLEADTTLPPLTKACVTLSMKAVPVTPNGPGKLTILIKHVCQKFTHFRDELVPFK